MIPTGIDNYSKQFIEALAMPHSISSKTIITLLVTWENKTVRKKQKSSTVCESTALKT